MSHQRVHHGASQNDVARELLGLLPERWGRMDKMSRAAIVEVGRLLKAEGVLAGSPPTLAGGWTGGLIIGSRRGSLAVDLEYAQTFREGPGMASPHLFSYTLPNIPLAETAIQYGLTGPVFSLISDIPYEEALQEARLWIEDMVGAKKIIVAGDLDIFPSGESAEVTAKLKVLRSE